MTERKFSQLTRMSRISYDQERCLGAGHHVFIEALKE
jgi:hypothetical protein